MNQDKICDTCRYYYAYGLTHGTCMHVLLSKESMKDKEVKYMDSCDKWIQNDNRQERKELMFSYEELKKEYGLRKYDRKQNKKLI